jgi:hypothetical protein
MAAPHGFFGIEDRVVKSIADRIRATDRPAPDLLGEGQSRRAAILRELCAAGCAWAPERLSRAVLVAGAQDPSLLQKKSKPSSEELQTFFKQ